VWVDGRQTDPSAKLNQESIAREKIDGANDIWWVVLLAVVELGGDDSAVRLVARLATVLIDRLEAVRRCWVIWQTCDSIPTRRLSLCADGFILELAEPVLALVIRM
jgi:hypothetical protein